MTLDTIDTAFVNRRRPPAATGRETKPPAPCAMSTRSERRAPAVWSPAAPAADIPQTPLPVAPALATSPLVAALLEQARTQWTEVALAVEAARREGMRVVAVAGGEPGEGRSTLVECLAITLRRRGAQVVESDLCDLPTHVRGPTHDKRIVLVDAGIWFPLGPIRRDRLLVASLGCDAVLLVRRADRPAVPAREAAATAVGIHVIGEVLTFGMEVGDATGGEEQPT